MAQADNENESIQSARRGVVAVIVRKTVSDCNIVAWSSKSRFLVIRRSQAVVAPGMYCFPGGGIEAQETDEAALIRELREELAVEIRPCRLLWNSITPWNVHLSWWLSELASADEFIPNLAEVESVHWLTSKEMLELPDLLASNRHFLELWAKNQDHWCA